MVKITSQERRVLAILRDRPLSADDLGPLVGGDPTAARETVRHLLAAGLVSPLADALRPRVASIGGERGGPEVDVGEPLTLTFKGFMRLNPLVGTAG